MVLLLCGVSNASADARCFKLWHYPWPQNCNAHGVYLRTSKPSRAILPAVFHPPVSVPDPVPDILLPDMSATWGGAMDSELELQMQRQRAIRSLEK